MKQKVLKTGNSLAVVVPADFVKKVGVEAGDQVVVDKNLKDASLTYHFPTPRQLQLQAD